MDHLSKRYAFTSRYMTTSNSFAWFRCYTIKSVGGKAWKPYETGINNIFRHNGKHSTHLIRVKCLTEEVKGKA